jgi:hypothetical protein
VSRLTSTDLERELAAIEARHVARRQEIEQSHAVWVAELERLEQAIADGTTTRAGALRSWKRRYPNTRPMDLGEAHLELYERLRQADEDYRRQLEAFDLRKTALLDLIESKDVPESGAPDKDFSGPAVEDAVRLWKLGQKQSPPASQNAIAKATDLSRSAVRRIVRLVAVGALDWSEQRGKGWLGIDGLFRATPQRVSLRELEKAHGLKPLA